MQPFHGTCLARVRVTIDDTWLLVKGEAVRGGGTSWLSCIVVEVWNGLSARGAHAECPWRVVRGWQVGLCRARSVTHEGGGE